MASHPGSRLHRIRAASLVVLGAFACDLGVEPPADAPLLAVSAREVNLFVARGSEDPDVVTVQISNNGSGTLSGLRVEDPVYVGTASGWLDRTLQDSTLTLSADGLTAGDTLETDLYEASVDVVADAAGNSPRTISVTLQVGESQRIALSVEKVIFATMATNPQPPSQTVTISNGGDGVLSRLAVDDIVYGDGEPTGWLALADTLVQARADTVVELRPNAVPDEASTLHATVIVGSSLADPPKDSILVEYIVAPPPTLVLSATTLDLEAIEGDTALLVREIALRELNGRPLTDLTEPVSSDPEWLTASRDPVDAPATLTITVDPDGLDGDREYPGTVSISSSAGVEEEVAVSLWVRPGPTVHASMETVRFTVAETDLLIPRQLVRVENSGFGTLAGPWTVDAPDWLSASLRDAADSTTACVTTPCDLVLQVVARPAASQTGTVEITGGGSTADVTVQFEPLPGPSPVLSSDTVTFRSDVPPTDPPAPDFPLPPMLTVAIANAGTRVLPLRCVQPCVEYEAAGDPQWLGIARLSGTTLVDPTTTAPATLELRPSQVPVPDTTEVLPRRYSATVVLEWGLDYENTVRLPVVFEVGKVEAETPAIGLSADSVLLRYVKTEATPAVLVGLEDLTSVSFRNLRVDEKPSWLTTGFVGGDDPPTTLQLTLNVDELDGLDPPLQDVVTLAARGTGGAENPDPVDITVALEVAGPAMAATSDRVVFRAYEGQTPLPGPQRLTVSNAASGTLTGVFAGTRQCFDVAPSSPSTSVPAPALITLTPNSSASSCPLNGTVEAYGDMADNSPLPIEVQLQIDAGPTLKLASRAVRMSSVEGSAAADTTTVDIFNSGKGDLGVLGAVGSQPWDTAFIDSSDVPARLVIVAKAEALTSDTYKDNVVVTSASGAVANVAVTFDVAPQPEIQVSPTALVFHADANTDIVPPEQTITVFDPAGGPSGQIAASIESDTIDWLDVAVDDATTPVTVVVGPNRVLDSRMSPYEATVAIESTVSTGDVQRVHVTYNIDVGRDPVIELSDTRLEFRRPTSAEDVVPAQTVEITNSGSRTLRELSVEDVTDGGPVDWLFVLLDSRIAPATLTVAIQPAEAAATQRSEATLEITGEDAEPQRLTVVLREGG